MSILVTGATGTVGRHVARHLGRAAREPSRHRASDEARGRAPLARAASRGGEPVEGLSGVPLDFNDPATFGAALSGTEAIFLVRPPAMSRVDPLLSFVDAAAEAGVRRVVFLSLLGAERNPVVPHRSVEKHLEASELGWTFLRASFFMQNLLGPHLADILEGGEVVVPAGRGATSFVDARDLGEAGARILAGEGHEGRAYDLTGGEALTYGEVAAILSEVTGREIRYPEPGVIRFVGSMRRRGHPWGYTLVMAGIYTTARLGLADRVAPDLAELLGRPPTTFREFAEDHRDRFAGIPEGTQRTP